MLGLDDSRATPAERLDDGRDYVPTNKWVAIGHHFAAIAGPGPLVGPTLAAQFGYLPGTLWLILGAVLAGCVQDFVILFCSIRRDGPDAVVLDLRMPGMSGFEVARAVRADPDPTIRSTPLLACSASVQAEVRREALDAGCDAFEGKPIDIRTFPDLLLGLIAQRRPR